MLKGLLGSRKFVIAIVTSLVVALNRKMSLNLTEHDINNIVMVVTVAIAGESTIDVAKAWKAPHMAEVAAAAATNGSPTEGDKKP